MQITLESLSTNRSPCIESTTHPVGEITYITSHSAESSATLQQVTQ